ncbi:hypothetical protein [Alteromonas sp. M12]|uniref:hypothetical protein n=1 Tax=Alteromonas sp. M12 TaxID=3135644 RepID=UPI00319EB71C
MKSRQLSEKRKMLYNATTNYIYFFLFAFLNFLLNPIFVGLLGTYYFAIWKTSLKVFDFLTMFDGRASQSIKWVIAQQRKNKLLEKQFKRAVFEALSVTLKALPYYILVLLTCSFTVNYLFEDFVEEDFLLVSVFGLLLSLHFLINLMCEVIDGVFVGMNEAYKSKSLKLLFLIFLNLFIVLNLIAGFGIIGIALSYLISTTLLLLILIFLLKSEFDWFKLKSLGEINREKTVIQPFSKWMSVWGFSDKLFVTQELFCISILLGTTAVTSFIFSSFIQVFSLSVTLLIGSAVMPYLANGNKTEGHSNFINGIKVYKEILYFITSILFGYMVIFNASFVFLWIGSDHYVGQIENFLLSLLFVFISLIRSDSQVGNLSLDLKSRALWSLIFCIGAFLFVYILFDFYPNMITILTVILAFRCLFYVTQRELVYKEIKGVGSGAKLVCVIFFLSPLVMYLGSNYLAESWLNLFIMSTLYSVIFSAIYYLFILDSSSRSFVFTMFRKVIG